MSPAKVFVFLAVFLAWVLTARAALANEPSDLDMHLDDVSSEDLDDWAIEERFVPDDIRVRDPLAGASLGGRGSSATISIGAFREQRSDGFRETGGLLLVGIPFDRFLAPKRDLRLASLHSSSADDEYELHDPEQQGDEAEVLVLGERRIVAEALVSPAIARACVLAALRAHGFMGDERLDSLASRARASAALPELRLRATRATDASLRLSPTQYDPYRYTEGEAAGHRLEARMSWRLDRLLFADQEVALERIRLQRSDARSKLTTRVLRALFEWQRARALSLDPALSPEQEAAFALRLLEAEATLSVLTGGGCGSDRPAS